VTRRSKAWIALKAGFQVEPSDLAKSSGPDLSAAWLLFAAQAADPSARRSRTGLLLQRCFAARTLIALVEKDPPVGVTLAWVFTLAVVIVVSGHPDLLWCSAGLAGVSAVL